MHKVYLYIAAVSALQEKVTNSIAVSTDLASFLLDIDEKFIISGVVMWAATNSGYALVERFPLKKCRETLNGRAIYHVSARVTDIRKFIASIRKMHNTLKKKAPIVEPSSQNLFARALQ